MLPGCRVSRTTRLEISRARATRRFAPYFYKQLATGNRTWPAIATLVSERISLVRSQLEQSRKGTAPAIECSGQGRFDLRFSALKHAASALDSSAVDCSRKNECKTYNRLYLFIYIFSERLMLKEARY